MDNLSTDKKLLTANLNQISKQINQTKGQFEKFQILSTYTEVLRDPILYSFAQNKDFDSAMSYLSKVAPTRSVPRYIQVLSNCGFLVQENEEEVRLISKSDSATAHVLKNDKIGSGSAALKVAAITFAQEVDGVKYSVDFNVEERKRDVERFTEGKISYEQYCSNKDEGPQLPKYATVDFFDDDFKLIVTPDQDCSSSTPLDADSMEEAYEKFKGTGFAMCARVKKPATVRFPLSGHVKQVVGNTVHILPVKETFDLVKGPEFDEVVEAMLTAIRSGAKYEGPIGEKKYDAKAAHKESTKVAGKQYLSVSLQLGDYSAEAESKIAEVAREDETVEVKYRSVKHDFQKHRDNLQINREVYDKMMEIDFVVPKSYKSKVTQMKKALSGLTFDEMAWEGASMTKEYLTTTAYAQSIAASPGRVNYTGASMRMSLSIFLDVLIKSPAQFPDMQMTNDGKYRFLTGIGNATVIDPARDQYEIYRNRQTDQIKQQTENDRKVRQEKSELEEQARVQYEKLVKIGVIDELEDDV